MTERQENMTPQHILDAVVESIQEKKGENITVLDLRSIDNAITSFFVICDGTSNVHVDSIADSVEELVRKNISEKPFHVEGRDNAEWILLDYLDVIVHVFQKSTRELYKIEELWADAKREDIAELS